MLHALRPMHGDLSVPLARVCLVIGDMWRERPL
jgi:hypothetical protein